MYEERLFNSLACSSKSRSSVLRRYLGRGATGMAFPRRTVGTSGSECSWLFITHFGCDF